MRLSRVWPSVKLGLSIFLALLFSLYGGTGLLPLENHQGEILPWLAAMIGFYFVFGGLFGYFNKEHWKLAGFLAWSAILIAVADLFQAWSKGYKYWLVNAVILCLPFASALFGAYAAPKLWREGVSGLRLKRKSKDVI